MEHSTPDVSARSTSPDDDTASAPVASQGSEAGERLSGLAERAADILERWSVAGERHERAVNQLESQLTEFELTSARLQRETSLKMQDLERAVHHEWTALREVHEEPIKQLREQANSLTEVCIATAHSAQRGFDQAEARLAAIELDLQQRISELRREVQSVVGELRVSTGQGRIGASPPAWPLDGVTRLHQQLRQGVDQEGEVALIETATSRDQASDIDPPVRVSEPSQLQRSSPSIVPPVNPELSDRVRVLERALDDRDAQTREVAERARRSTIASRFAIGAMVVILVIAAAFALRVQSQVGTQVEQAEQRSRQATTDAARETAATREQAAREIAAARELATRAQMVSTVLAAPDLLRFNLVATNQTSAGTAQALWSRTNGFVLSGTRLAPVPEGKTYQVWLLARGQAISAGTFAPDASGSVTLTAEAPPIAAPVISVVVSLEPAGGSARPDGPPVLVRTRALP